jgi:kelch-like protein 17 (actinfilin)/kelch-like protein 20/actin-binding protein IPP
MMCTPQAALNTACTLDSDCLTNNCSASYCSVVTGPPNWLTVATLTGGRYFMAAAPLANGKIVLGGGRTGSPTATTARTDVYDIYANTFAMGGALPAAREAAAGVTESTGTYAFAIGGSSYVTTNTVYSGGAWYTSNAAPTGRGYMQCALATDGAAYCAGGASAASGAAQTMEAFTYNVGWTTVTSMPTGRYGLMVAAHPNGLVYAIGGYDASDNPLGNNESYNPMSKTWAALAPLPGPRGDSGAATGTDGRIYVVAGLDTAQRTRVDAYTPALNRWEVVDALRQGARSSHSVVAGADGRIYVFGNSSTADWPSEVYGPNPILSTRNAAAGTVVTLTGNNFGPSARITVTFNNVQVAKGTTDASGGVTTPITFNVPNVGSGTYKVVIVDNRSAFPVTFPFVVP